jgi:Na+/alanine symporter
MKLMAVSINDKKEAVWFAAVAIIALLVLIILFQSNNIIEAYEKAGSASIPGTFWLIVGICSSLCALVPYLLKESKPIDFRIIGIVLTGVAPATLIVFVLFSLWRSVGSQ